MPLSRTVCCGAESLRADGALDAPRLGIAERAVHPGAGAGLQSLAFEPRRSRVGGERQHQSHAIAVGLDKERVEHQAGAAPAIQRVLPADRRNRCLRLDRSQDSEGPGGDERLRQCDHLPAIIGGRAPRAGCAPGLPSCRCGPADAIPPSPAVVSRVPAMPNCVAERGFHRRRTARRRGRGCTCRSRRCRCAPRSRAVQSGFRRITSAISRSVGSDSSRIVSLLKSK